MTCTVGPTMTYGGECGGAANCTTGQCASDPERTAGGDPDFCTAGCATPADCGGDLCAGSICYVGRDDCLNDDDCPGVNNVCVFDLDGRFRCRTLCLEDRHCAAIQDVCHGGTGANPPGFCRPPGPLAEGTACLSGLDCDSLACTGGGASPTCLGAPRVRMDAGPGDAALPDAVVELDADMMDAAVGGPDAAPPDGGPPQDSGGWQPEDASPDDSGESIIGSRPEGGCGCSASRGAEPNAVLWLALAWLAATRHRRSRCSSLRSLERAASDKSTQPTWERRARG
jgi:MYXO-CTERM domain-containing protein